MLISNLKFSNIDFVNNKKSQTILFTSSIKDEGKTLASVNTALNLANDLYKRKKVILLGTDLRNPQVHKSFGVEKIKKAFQKLFTRKIITIIKNILKDLIILMCYSLALFLQTLLIYFLPIPSLILLFYSKKNMII